MSARRKVSVLVGMGICGLLWLSCGGSPPRDQPIRLGWIGALTGASAAVAQWEVHGIELALDEVSRRGGICGGRKLQLIKYDDQADPTKSVILAQKLVAQDQVLFAFATTNSNTTLAVLPVFTKAGVGQMTGALSTDLTIKGSRYIFRDTAAGPVFETTLVEHLAGMGFKRFALISDSSAYGKGQADFQQAALRNNKLVSVIRETYNTHDDEFTSQLTHILQVSPEVLLLGGYAVPSGLIARQARQLGFMGQIAGGVSIGTPKFIEIAGDAAEGVIFTSLCIDNNANAAIMDFAGRYQAKWGYQPGYHAARAYDGAKMVIAAVERSCNDLNSTQIAGQLHATTDYQGLQGTFTYQENGEGISEAEVGIIRNGRLMALGER